MHVPLGFEAPPTSLVADGRQQLGHFHGPPGRVNLLDARFRGLPRALRRWRLKEWEAIQIATPSLFVNLAVLAALLIMA